MFSFLLGFAAAAALAVLAPKLFQAVHDFAARVIDRIRGL